MMSEVSGIQEIREKYKMLEELHEIIEKADSLLLSFHVKYFISEKFEHVSIVDGKTYELTNWHYPYLTKTQKKLLDIIERNVKKLKANIEKEFNK